MPKPVLIYTTRGCPHCVRAKDLLKRKGVSFQEMDITDKADEREKLEKRYGWMTVPIIVIGDSSLAGLTSFMRLIVKVSWKPLLINKLDSLDLS